MSAENPSPVTGSNPLLEKAERYMRSAQILIEEEDYDSAASRAYYAMLYIAQSLLEQLGLSFSSHHAVISAYGQHFAKTGELDPAFHKALLIAFNQRQLGDYTIHSGIRREDVELLLRAARDFLNAANERLQKQT